MKFNKYTLLILPVYCIPFVFLSMYDDHKNYSMIVYGLMVIAVWYFAFLAKRKSSIIVLLLGNFLSFLSSYFWVVRVDKLGEWDGYFKPLSSVQALVAFTILIVLLQMVVYSFTRAVENGKDGKSGKKGEYNGGK